LKSLGTENVRALQMDELADPFAGGPVQGLLPFIVLRQSSKEPPYSPCVNEEMQSSTPASFRALHHGENANSAASYPVIFSSSRRLAE
jgi:hypothetical protein